MQKTNLNIGQTDSTSNTRPRKRKMKSPSSSPSRSFSPASRSPSRERVTKIHRKALTQKPKEEKQEETEGLFEAQDFPPCVLALDRPYALQNPHVHPQSKTRAPVRQLVSLMGNSLCSETYIAMETDAPVAKQLESWAKDVVACVIPLSEGHPTQRESAVNLLLTLGQELWSLVRSKLECDVINVTAAAAERTSKKKEKEEKSTASLSPMQPRVTNVIANLKSLQDKLVGMIQKIHVFYFGVSVPFSSSKWLRRLNFLHSEQCCAQKASEVLKRFWTASENAVYHFLNSNEICQSVISKFCSNVMSTFYLHHHGYILPVPSDPLVSVICFPWDENPWDVCKWSCRLAPTKMSAKYVTLKMQWDSAGRGFHLVSQQKHQSPEKSKLTPSSSSSSSSNSSASSSKRKRIAKQYTETILMLTHETLQAFWTSTDSLEARFPYFET